MTESNDLTQAEKPAKKYNILKVRDDSAPLYFSKTDTGAFELRDETGASWLDDGQLDYKALRKHIEPWLTALFQSEHLSLLAGAGLTHAVHMSPPGSWPQEWQVTLARAATKIESSLQLMSQPRPLAEIAATLRIRYELPMSYYAV